jgi:hypothetical protein
MARKNFVVKVIVHMRVKMELDGVGRPGGKGRDKRTAAAWGLLVVIIKTNSQKQFRTVVQCRCAFYHVPTARLRQSGVYEVAWLVSVSESLYKLCVCVCVCVRVFVFVCMIVYNCVCVSV